MNSSRKRLLIYDGDCGFCKRLVSKWRGKTGDRIKYVPDLAPKSWNSYRVTHLVLTLSPKAVPFIMRDFSLTCIIKEVPEDAIKQIYTGADSSDLKPVGEWDIDR